MSPPLGMPFWLLPFFTLELNHIFSVVYSLPPCQVVGVCACVHLGSSQPLLYSLPIRLPNSAAVIILKAQLETSPLCLTSGCMECQALYSALDIYYFV